MIWEQDTHARFETHEDLKRFGEETKKRTRTRYLPRFSAGYPQR